MSDPSHRDISQPAVDPARSPDSTRRRFLIAFGAGAAGAASASALAAAPAPIVEATAPAAASQGYRETEHVRNYYATTRI
jgi:hypothetical protein